MTSRSSLARTLATRISSRTAAVALTCAVLVLLAVAGIVPQTGSPKAAEGFWACADVAGVVHTLALDRIVTTWPAALVFAAAALSMAVATTRQVRVAHARTFGLAARGRRLAVEDDAAMRRALRAAGFVRVARGDGGEKHVRHPWGYWGGVVLHVGLLLSVAAALASSLAESRGLVRIAEGESFGPPARFSAEQHGLLAGRAAAPETFTVAAASASYWPDRTPRQVETTLAFAGGGSAAIGVNRPLVRDGVRYYQGQTHGRTFLLDLTRPDGSPEHVRLDISAPTSPAAAAYLGYAVREGDDAIRAKYFADASMRSMTGVPLLVLRLEKGGAETARAELRPGETAALGPYTVALTGAPVWTEIQLVRDAWLPLLFVAFVLVVAGSALIYVTPPAAVYLAPAADGRWELAWEPSRFAGELPAEVAAASSRAGDAA